MPRAAEASPLRSLRLSKVVTLTTDFGVSDSYVAEVKAVLLRRRPHVTIVDVTHDVPPQDVLAGSFVLERALRAFAPGTLHLAIVDPGVGSERRILLASIARQWVIAPDNGLITWPWRRLHHDERQVYNLTWRPTAAIGSTFHGRDIMAPAAARLLAGMPPARLGQPGLAPVLLDFHLATDPGQGGRIIHIDRFGNATTNIPESVIVAHRPNAVKLGRRTIPIKRTYADVPIGEPVALIGSSGLVEIALRNGNVARTLKIKAGAKVKCG